MFAGHYEGGTVIRKPTANAILRSKKRSGGTNLPCLPFPLPGIPLDNRSLIVYYFYKITKRSFRPPSPVPWRATGTLGIKSCPCGNHRPRRRRCWRPIVATLGAPPARPRLLVSRVRTPALQKSLRRCMLALGENAEEFDRVYREAHGAQTAPWLPTCGFAAEVQHKCSQQGKEERSRNVL